MLGPEPAADSKLDDRAHGSTRGLRRVRHRRGGGSAQGARRTARSWPSRSGDRAPGDRAQVREEPAAAAARPGGDYGNEGLSGARIRTSRAPSAVSIAPTPRHHAGDRRSRLRYPAAASRSDTQLPGQLRQLLHESAADRIVGGVFSIPIPNTAGRHGVSKSEFELRRAVVRKRQRRAGDRARGAPGSARNLTVGAGGHRGLPAPGGRRRGAAAGREDPPRVRRVHALRRAPARARPGRRRDREDLRLPGLPDLGDRPGPLPGDDPADPQHRDRWRRGACGKLRRPSFGEGGDELVRRQGQGRRAQGAGAAGHSPRLGRGPPRPGQRAQTNPHRSARGTTWRTSESRSRSRAI